MSEKIIPGKHLWYYEQYTGGDVGFAIKISNMVHSEQTEYQRIDIFDNPTLGRVFALDGITMTTEADEFMYHELLTHVPMFSHPNPEKVLVIGGGDGGTLREVLKHESVKKAILCEIDPAVVEAARKYLSTSVEFDNPKAEIVTENAAEFVKNFKGEFDVIIVDSTDPTAGEGGHLFTKEFYRSCYEAMTENGVLSAQTEDPVYDLNWLKIAYKRISSVFPVTKVYQGFMPTYPSGYWLYTFASKGVDPIKNLRKESVDKMIPSLKYYNSEVHLASFALPNFLLREIERMKDS